MGNTDFLSGIYGRVNISTSPTRVHGVAPRYRVNFVRTSKVTIEETHGYDYNI